MEVESILFHLCYFNTMTFHQNKQILVILRRLARAVVQDIAVSARGMGFDSKAGQIGHNVANGLLLPQRFFQAVLPRC